MLTLGLGGSSSALAEEMQNRLFGSLGEWAMKPDDDLRQELETLGEADLGADRLRLARTLFARALETPGGLKIQTIHSFCASLLRRFPLEAGVSPQFAEMEDRAAEMLRAEIVDEIADGKQAYLIDAIARYATDTDLDSLTKAIVSNRDAFEKSTDLDGLLNVFGLPEAFTGSDLKAQVFLGDEAELLRDLTSAMNAGSVTDAKTAKALAKPRRKL